MARNTAPRLGNMTALKMSSISIHKYAHLYDTYIRQGCVGCFPKEHRDTTAGSPRLIASDCAYRKLSYYFHH